jgi:hypothetical protein
MKWLDLVVGFETFMETADIEGLLHIKTGMGVMPTGWDATFVLRVILKKVPHLEHCMQLLI